MTAQSTSTTPLPSEDKEIVRPAAPAIGADHARFNLNDLYTGLDDPTLAADITAVEELYARFSAKHRGNLSRTLGTALDDLAEISRLSEKPDTYLSLRDACDVGNQKVKAVDSNMKERLARASAEHMTFFDIELGKMEASALEHLMKEDPRVAFHEPYIRRIRELAVHLLDEKVERALTLREPYGPSELEEFYEERMAEAKFVFGTDKDGKPRTMALEEMIKVLSTSTDRDERARALAVINKGLEEQITPIAIQTLNSVIGKKRVEDTERGYAHSMSARNLSNQVSDDVVHALHEAVGTKGAELAQRYYRLAARYRGYDKLLWSDRNAPLGATSTTIPWEEAVAIVDSAYRSFSPTLAGLFRQMLESGWVDAPFYEKKATGAFNISVVLPEPLGVRSYNLLNYLGTPRDVETLAHESGHGVHGLLAGKAQGALMAHAPIAYCETASIFAEMVTFNHLLGKISSPAERLELLMGKSNDFLNSVVRQISFSEFEQRIHRDRQAGKLTTEQFVGHWKDVTTRFYGADGDVFEYRDMDHMWSYISHFCSPFYVYGYAFGELLTQSLYAVKDQFGPAFEPLYLDLLRAGGTKDAVGLLAPFGLNPKDPNFWVRGMEASAEKWIGEAEALLNQRGV